MSLSSRFASLSVIDPDQMRTSLLTLILRVSVGLGLVVYVPSVYFLLKQGSVGLVVIDTVALFGVIGLLRFDRVPYRWRAAIVCLIAYTLGVGLLVRVGSISQIYLFGFSVVTVLLLGARVGLGAALLSSASLLAVGGLGYAAPEMVLPNWSSHGFAEWAVITINFTLVNTLITLAVGAVLTALDNALRAEIAQRVSLDRERTLLRTLIDTLPDVVFTKDTSGRFVNCNPATLALFGMDREDQLAGKTVFEQFPPELAATYHADDLAVLTGRAVLNREEQSLDREGNPRWYLTTKVPLRGAAGETTGLIGISRNITDRKQAEAERDRLIHQLQLQIERMPLAYLLSDRDFRYTDWNPAAERVFGMTKAEVLGRHPFEVIVSPELQPIVARLHDRIREGSLDAHGEFENLSRGGTVVCEWHNTPIFESDGAFAGMWSLVQDVTERKKLEEQLRQAQKMEAVGQLAGGVAHDFNNLLSVVLGYSDMMLADMAPGSPARGDVEEIRRAGARASELTRQLLMFSRQQVVAPAVLDLNDVLGGVDAMLRRLLGEDVELTLVPGASLGHVRADRGSIEQVIMNLAVNARDAMPVGGKLTMGTANVVLDEEYATVHLGAKPGAYVMLSVSDTGTGMDRATLARVFEPFFTTKEQGKGTGLGLATVFGIVQQSGGTVWVYSELGLGTTFKVYLPRVDEDVDESRTSGAPTTLRGTETILLVEDEDQVRDVARGILRRHGYTVLEARSAGEAILLSEQEAGPIHLLLSDVVMPQMSGPVLAKRLAPSRPAMRVLCMSGYTDDAAVRHGVIEAEFAYLQKPLTIEALTRKVREVLDGSRGANGSPASTRP
ncbi:MAG: PAS domain S-box protein [Deltaproteobacteria bacterium]|nr:PAS domain S-box protein [Myxococcales bacterium]MDP3213074.1 PAS domain S-box protein [Deltaproteobacteria bacterium]